MTSDVESLILEAKMVKLLGKTLGKQQKNGIVHETATPVEEQPRDRILVLVPGEGGFAFRLLAFPSIEHAAAYGFEHFPQRVHQLFSFRPHHERPPDQPSGAPGQVEAIVMVRDEDRHGTVHLYSFVDMETAHAFVRAEGMRGLNLRLVLVFWSEPVALYKDVTPEINPVKPEIDPPPPAALTQWQQPKNPVFDSLKPESEAPVFADEVPSKHSSTFDPPFPPNTKTSPPASANFVPAIPTPPPAPAPVPVPAPEVFAPPPPPPTPAPEVVAPSANGTSFTTQKKEPRRWNAGEDFAAPVAAQAAPSPTADRQAGDQGRIGGTIHRIRSWPGWDGFGPVIVGAALLRWQVYDEVRKDPYAGGRAALLVGTTVGASALAAFFSGPLGFFFYGFFAAIGWALYSLCIYVLGTQFFGGHMERGETKLFLNRLGLAFAPGPLVILGIIPIYGPMFTLGALLWVMVTSIKATEIALEMERQHAAFTAIISWLALFAIAVVIPSLAV